MNNNAPTFRRSLTTAGGTLIAATALSLSGCVGEGTDTEEDDPGLASSAIQWSAFKPAGFVPGQDITVPAGTSVVFDGDAADAIGKLTVLGSFECASGARTLEAKAILVSGPSAVFKCGTVAAPRAAQFKIHLSGKASFNHMEMMAGCASMPPDNMPMQSSGYQAFVVTCGATLDLHGAAPAAPWTRLKATAAVGATQIKVPAVDCARWSAGSSVVIASSSFDHNQAETRTLASCATAAGISTLTLTTALNYAHWGAPTATYAAGATSLPLVEQAEVALLNRPILFQGTEATDAASKAALEDKKGANMMFMMAPGHVRIEGVEFDTVGRMGELGRYPAHWHKVGNHLGPNNVPYDAYIKSSVIHRSFNRCVTLHETNGVTVQDNVCHDHYGHGYFLEEGNETNNTFDGNLGLGSKAVPNGRQILTTDRTSDNVGRYAAPSTFWISNPANTYKNNVAAGSDGSGFWFGLKDAQHQPDGVAAAPVNTALKVFENNLAHSSRQGITLDGGPNGDCAANPRNDCTNPAAFDADTADYQTTQTVYTPPSPATFRKLTAYKCREFGLWFNAVGNNIVKESIFADNQIGVALVFDSVLRDSVILAKTDNFDPATEIPKTSRAFGNKQFAATLVYDGPTFLENVHLESFPPSMSATEPGSGKVYTFQPMLFSLTVAAANRSPVHRVRALTFGPGAPPVVADFDHVLGHYSKDNWSAAVWDMDGSLTGKAGSTLVPAESIQSVPGCTTDARFHNAMVCPGRYGLITLSNTYLQFDLFRKDTATGAVLGQFLLPSPPDPDHSDIVPGAPYVDHQFSFPLNRVGQDTYVVQIHAPGTVPTSNADPTPLKVSDFSNGVPVRLHWANDMESSPPLEIYQLFRSCQITNVPSLTNVSVTQADGDVVRLRFTAHTPNVKGWATGTFGGVSYPGQKFQSVAAQLRCYVPSSVAMGSPTVDRQGHWYFQNSDVVGSTSAADGPARFEAHVKGSNLKLNVIAGLNRGYAKVTVDGLAPKTIDLDASSYMSKDITIATGLGSGEHKVVIEHTGTKNAASTGTFVVLRSLSAF